MNAIRKVKRFLSFKKQPRQFQTKTKGNDRNATILKTEASRTYHGYEMDENFKCRICQDSGDNPNDEIAAPCDCIGSIKFLHVNCLKEWIKEKKSLECELCHKPYKSKWRIWALNNKIIKDGNKQQSKSIFIFNNFFIYFPFLWFAYLLISYILVVAYFPISLQELHSEYNLKFNLMNFIGILLLVFIVMGCIWWTTEAPAFYKKIEEYLHQLFPHSSRETYSADYMNLPITSRGIKKDKDFETQALNMDAQKEKNK